MNSKDFKEFSDYQVGNVADDTSVGIRLKHIGTGSVTSVVLTTATGLILISDGYTQTYPFAAGLTLNTYGLLVDAINAANCTETSALAGGILWEAKLLDALRSDTSTSTMIGAPTTYALTGEGYYDLLVDTSEKKDVTYRVSYDRGIHEEKPMHKVILTEVNYNVNVNGVSANGFRIYKWDNQNKCETQIYRKASVVATATTPFGATENQKITAKPGDEIIVRVIDGTSIATAAGTYMDVSYIRE
jgi:hypothetical protein